jgi:lipopolysaccharide transport system ATP-binding protein
LENNTVIQVNGVSKKFCRSLKRSMWYGFRDILRDTASLRTKSDRLRRKEFWAVDDVSFELRKGDRLGLIGPNGAGKTTLLKMLNGIIIPDKGNLRIKGRVGALIQLGAGFHPQLTGRENIFINGAILGMGKREIDKKFDAIVEFADIGDFLDTPVKHYSSGMFVRLGFAVAIHCEPEVLLVDEVLAVGDLNFQSKCMEQIGRLCEEGTTVILVSHDISKIERVCGKAIWLDNGHLMKIGSIKDVVNSYMRDQDQKLYNTESSFVIEGVRKGSGRARVENFEVQNTKGEEVDSFLPRESISFSFEYSLKDVSAYRLWICVVNQGGLKVAGDLSETIKNNRYPDNFVDRAKYTLRDMPFFPGRYYVIAGISDEKGLVWHDRVAKAGTFLVKSTSNIKYSPAMANFYGSVLINGSWDITQTGLRLQDRIK